MRKHKTMSFPKKEWKKIEAILNTQGSYSTTRCCKELGKYKAGEIYQTPWSDLVKIIKIKRYTKAEDIPSWNTLDKGMKISVKMGKRYGNNIWEHIYFKKI